VRPGKTASQEAFTAKKKRKAKKKWLKLQDNKQKNQRKKWKAASRKPDDGFYKSEAWRELRFVALKRADGCCALCGRSNRLHGVVLHVDHIKPRSRFPHLSLVASNLQVLCEDCNLGKGNRDTTDWRADNVVQIVWDDAEDAA
jgi:5-methylcytosine-specific restriction endonuclease McrA